MTQSLFNRLTTRAKTEIYRRQYHSSAKAILGTPPLTPGAADFTLLSMVQKRDVLSYLVAVKSFAHQLNPRRIVVVCDPSMDAQDKDCLTQHIPHIELRDADQFTHPGVPRGGTWERLFAIAGFAAQSYIVQLDADTLTLGDLAAVQQAIAANHGFVIGEEPDQQIYTLHQTAARVNLPAATPGARPIHIQICAEAAIDQVGLAPDEKYVRGCSGFTGFPPDPKMHDKLVRFAVAMGTHFGERWKEWGTEQITSNYLVANCMPSTLVLPYPTYGTPDVEDDSTVFLHFIGSMRFINNRYRQLTMQTINLLLNITGR
jgi:hypothetical protein